MGTYNLPRNVKGEGRILFIFSTKALIYTFVGGGIGLLLYFLFKALGIGMIGIILAIVFALIGFSIATFKIPNSNAFKITKETGGENIDEVIKRYIKFKFAKNRVYVYTEPKREMDKKTEETKED